MSKEKVDAYREQKKHRKANLAKERAKKTTQKIVGWVVLAVIVVGLAAALVVTGMNQYKAYAAAKPDYSAAEQIVADYAGVTEDEAEDADADLEEVDLEDVVAETEAE